MNWDQISIVQTIFDQLGEGLSIPNETTDKGVFRQKVLDSIQDAHFLSHTLTLIGEMISHTVLFEQNPHTSFISEEVIPASLNTLAQKGLTFESMAAIVAFALPGSGRHGEQTLELLRPYMDSVEKVQALASLHERAKPLIALDVVNEIEDPATRQIAALGVIGELAIDLNDSLLATKVSSLINERTNTGYVIRHREEKLSLQNQRQLMQGWIAAGFLGARFTDAGPHDPYSSRDIFQMATQLSGVRASACHGTVDEPLKEEKVIIDALMMWNRTSKNYTRGDERDVKRIYDGTAQELFTNLLGADVSVSSKVFGLLALVQHGDSFAEPAREELSKIELTPDDKRRVSVLLKKMELPEKEAERSFSKPVFSKEMLPEGVAKVLSL